MSSESLEAEPPPVARVGDREEGEQVPREAEKNVQRLEGQGERRDVVCALEVRVAVLRGVIVQTEVAVLDDAGLVAHWHFF